MVTIDALRNATAEIQDRGYAILRGHFPAHLVDACRSAFWPRLLAYLESGAAANRGPHRHFLPMPFEPPCFSPPFFFDPDVLAIVRGTPNTTDTPRALASIRYVRRWYADASRDVSPIPRALWQAMTPEHQQVLRFPVGA